VKEKGNGVIDSCLWEEKQKEKGAAAAALELLATTVRKTYPLLVVVVDVYRKTKMGYVK
jgi:hypothetical protein